MSTRPSRWTSYEGSNPCGAGVSNKTTTLSAFTEFGDFNQAGFTQAGNPLVAQNKTYARYEIRVNRWEFDSIVANGWYLASNLPSATPPFKFFAMQSTEIKAAWRILTAQDTPDIRRRYFVVEGAEVFDISSKKCVKQDIALVGFHIVTKTPDRPQWIWSTFEQVDNVKAVSSEPTPPAGIPLSFNDPSQPQTLNPDTAPQPVSGINPPVQDPDPMQVVRMNPIDPQTMDMNRTYWALPGIKGTVWQNYMLVATQWPTAVTPQSPANAGAPFPTQNVEVANTTMETYMQFSGGTCMECHNISNTSGRDFVMFVGLNAYRPAVKAPADLFSAKLQASAQSEAPNSLASDPVAKSLAHFFANLRNKH